MCTVVLPHCGVYASRRGEVVRLLQRPNRELVDVPGNHNVVMTAPAAVAQVIRTTAPGSRTHGCAPR